MKQRTTAVLLAAAILTGFALMPVNKAFAHTFSTDESASFLSLMEQLRVHLDLVKSNLSTDMAMAEEHAQHAAMHLDESVIKEIAEKNERIARDLPASIDNLNNLFETGADKTAITEKITDIENLIGEAVSVRIDKEKLSDPTVQAQLFADIVDVTLANYNAAYGIGEVHVHSGMTEAGGHGSHSTDEMQSTEIVNMGAYQISQAMAVKAGELFVNLKPLAPAESKGAVDAVESGIAKLKDSIDRKESVEAVTVIVHGQIHENLQKAFNLQLEVPAEPIILEGKSTTGKFMVHINWISNDIGEENTFNIEITDDAGKKLEATYDIMLYKDGTHLDETHRAEQTAEEQHYKFDEVGNYVLRLENINGEPETVDIPMQVTPEFPAGALTLLGAVLGGAILAGRRKLTKI
jgi:hypothetical protein